MTTLDRLAQAAGPAQLPNAEEDALCEAVRDAMAAALTQKQRQVVEMYFFEGLSQGEIARLLGITQQVVHKRLHGTLRQGRLIGGALGRLRVALWSLAMTRCWVAPGAYP